MKKAIVKLIDGTIYEYESQYIWGYEDELNDTRREFIRIGNFIAKKSNIISIQIIDVEENHENEIFEEVETNE